MQIGGGQNRLKSDSHFKNSHKLPKIAISLALLFGGANIALAEESGGFVGIGVGYGGNSVRTNYSCAGNNCGGGAVSTTDNNAFGGVDYGFVAGYKQFFTPKLGLRYYASFNLSHSSFKYIGQYFTIPDTSEKTYATHLINYSANVDFLFNFMTNEMLDFGGFVGASIGGNTWLGSGLDDLENKFKPDTRAGGAFSFNCNRTSFDAAVNVGLRANIAKYHGVELVARVPFIATSFFNRSIAGNVGKAESLSVSLYRMFSVTARYTFSF